MTLDALLVDNAAAVDRVIVVACAGDPSLCVAEQRPGVELLIVPHRVSAGAARNLGRRQAGSAALLLFVDADCAPAPGAVGLLLATLARERLDAVAPSLLSAGGGLAAWLRHALEFKEAGPEAAGPWPWLVPSATLLCRSEVFDRAGGFPDLWPGEDLVFCHALHQAKARVRKVIEARSLHRHPPGWRRLFVHQYRLGFTAACARRITGMHGVVFVRYPLLAPLLLLGRAWRALAWFGRYRRKELALLLVLFPLYLAGLAVWTAGFVAAARIQWAAPR